MTSGEIKDSDQLWQLTVEQAREVLDAFLRTERDVFPTLQIGSLELDYSDESVRQALQYIASQIQTGRLDEEQQNIWFARLGYYFGESLCRAKPGLSWGLGNPDYAFANHPVVTGFAGDEEAEVITICRNMIESVAEGLSPSSRIDKGVSIWFETPVAGTG